MKLTAKQVERLADKLEYLEHDLLHIVVRDEIAKRFLENADDKNVIDFSWFYYDLYKPIYYREMIYEIIVEAKKRSEEAFENLFKHTNYGGRSYTAVEYLQQGYRRSLMNKYADKNSI